MNAQADLNLCLEHISEGTFTDIAAHFIFKKQGSVVQNLTKLLANLTLKFLSRYIANKLIFFAEKM